MPIETHRMMIACHGPEGLPEMFFCKVTGPSEEFMSFRDAAMADAVAQDMEGPMVVFDCEISDSAKTLVDLFDWDDASEVNVEPPSAADVEAESGE